MWNKKVHIHTIIDIVDKATHKITHSCLNYSTLTGVADSEQREKSKMVSFQTAQKLMGLPRVKVYARYRVDGNWFWQIVPN